MCLTIRVDSKHIPPLVAWRRYQIQSAMRYKQQTLSPWLHHNIRLILFAFTSPWCIGERVAATDPPERNVVV